MAPDIMTLGKPLGVRCRYLDETGLCAIYEERPAVCRSYLADEICREIAAPTLAERVGKYLRLFELKG
jgi:Fe-S-cluster containining protein